MRRPQASLAAGGSVGSTKRIDKEAELGQLGNSREQMVGENANVGAAALATRPRGALERLSIRNGSPGMMVPFGCVSR